jgi:Uma2 family endonuclease
MSAVAKRLMTVDAFLDFAEPRESRWELEDGVAYAMAPERMAHVRCEFEAALALSGAIKRAGLPCEAVIDGPAVRIGPRTAYQPDGLVCCGARLPDDAREAPAPVVIVEVLSPSTRSRDEGNKLVAYFSLPSVWHYLVIDPDDRVVVHHQRARDGRIEPRALHAGVLQLDPPGLEVNVAELFSAA